MVPMAIPTVGGMVVVVVSIFVVPVLYSAVKEFAVQAKLRESEAMVLSALSFFLIPVFYCSVKERNVDARPLSNSEGRNEE